VADPGIFQRGGGGSNIILGFQKWGSTLKMRYFYPILTKFYDERAGGSRPPELPLWIRQWVLLGCTPPFQVGIEML
jgi:hypothetical protein